MLQSDFMPCTEHATAMAVAFVCALVCKSLLYDIKSSQSSDVVLSLKPKHLSCLSCYSLLSKFADIVTECSIA